MHLTNIYTPMNQIIEEIIEQQNLPRSSFIDFLIKNLDKICDYKQNQLSIKPDPLILLKYTDGLFNLHLQTISATNQYLNDQIDRLNQQIQSPIVKQLPLQKQPSQILTQTSDQQISQLKLQIQLLNNQLSEQKAEHNEKMLSQIQINEQLQQQLEQIDIKDMKKSRVLQFQLDALQDEVTQSRIATSKVNPITPMGICALCKQKNKINDDFSGLRFLALKVDELQEECLTLIKQNGEQFKKIQQQEQIIMELKRKNIK